MRTMFIIKTINCSPFLTVQMPLLESQNKVQLISSQAFAFCAMQFDVECGIVSFVDSVNNVNSMVL